MERATPSLGDLAALAMVERGFLPEPPPEAVAQAARAELLTDGLRDLRGLPWTSIDNPESRDLDQVEASERVGADFVLRVGIADVDFFAPAGTPVDQFAQHNGTSVYAGARTFPMLPERLCFDLSSLLAGVPRRAVVIETRLGPDGAVRGGDVYPALIENHAKLDYPSVSAWLDGKAAAPAALAARGDLRAQVEMQDALAKLLAEQRRLAGALDVDTAQPRAVLDDKGNVVGMADHHQDRAGGIVEELMIASNRTVARHLDARGITSVRRVVKAPERWAKIVAYAAERGVQLPEGASSQALAGFVDRMRSEKADEFAIISLALVKLMGRGEYVAHRPGSEEVGHFGLATAQYTHATAPNRRYIDLITQRLVLGSHGYAEDDLARLAAHISEREAAAEKVQRRVIKSATAALLAPRVGDLFDGMITGASDKGIFVRTFDPAAEGKVVAGAATLEVAQRVRVRLRDVNVERGFIDFELA